MEGPLYALGTAIRGSLLYRFPVCPWNSNRDTLSHDVRRVLRPSGALLCLRFNGCRPAYRSQHSRTAGVEDGRRLAWRGGEGISPRAHSGSLQEGVSRQYRPPPCILCWELTRKIGRPERLQNGLGEKKKKAKSFGHAFQTQRKGACTSVLRTLEVRRKG